MTKNPRFVSHDTDLSRNQTIHIVAVNIVRQSTEYDNDITVEGGHPKRQSASLIHFHDDAL